MNGHCAIYAWDTPDSAAKCKTTQPAHFDHVEIDIKKIAVAGPIKDARGQSICSIFSLKIASVAEVEALLRADPYFGAGVWERWEIHPFIPVAGEWIGDKKC